MNKTAFASASLVVAIPGGVLTVLLVINFLKRANDMSTTFNVLAALTLALSFMLTITPIGIFVFSPKTEEASKTSEDEETGEEGKSGIEPEEAGEVEEELVAAEKGDTFDMDADENLEGGDFEIEKADEDNLFTQKDDDLDDFDLDERDLNQRDEDK